MVDSIYAMSPPLFEIFKNIDGFFDQLFLWIFDFSVYALIFDKLIPISVGIPFVRHDIRHKELVSRYSIPW